MNAANEFYEDMQSRRQATALNSNPSSSSSEDRSADVQSLSESESGNGEETTESGSATMRDGIQSPEETGVNQTPNG